MNRKTLLLRDSKTKITVHNEYIHIKSYHNSYIVAFRYIDTIYLNKAIDIDINSCYKMSQRVKLFLIDEDGYILATIKGADNEEV